MKITLPVSKFPAELKDYVPHGVHSKVQRVLTKGVHLDFSNLNPSKEQLTSAFGTETILKLNELPPGEYEKELARLQEEFVRRQIKVEDLSLENVDEANMIRVEGMLITLNENTPTRGDIEDLPEPDFQYLLQSVNKIENAPLEKGSEEPSLK